MLLWKRGQVLVVTMGGVGDYMLIGVCLCTGVVWEGGGGWKLLIGVCV